MTIKAKVTSTSVTAKVRLNSRASVVSPNFTPKVDVALTELRDVSITSVEDGYVLSYSSSLGKYIVKGIDVTNLEITQIDGGTF